MISYRQHERKPTRVPLPASHRRTQRSSYAFSTREGICFKTRDVSAKGHAGHQPGPMLQGGACMAAGPPSAASAWHPRTPASWAWWFRAQPVCSLGSVCGRDRAEPARESTLPRAYGLWHLSRVSCAPSPRGQPRALCLDHESHQSRGRHHRNPHHRPIGLQGPGCIDAAQRPAWQRWACLTVS